MSAILYDIALLNKIKNWVKDINMTITGPDETRRLFEYMADINNDKELSLPLIALRRSPTMIINNTRKNPATFDAYRKDADYYTNESIPLPKDIQVIGARINQLNFIPITLQYQIDIYTRYYEEAEEYVRNFIFNLINFNKVTIEIPYNDSRIQHNAYINLGNEANDNSDIPERLIAGQFTRKTLHFSIDGYLFDYRTKEAVLLGDIEVKTKLAKCDNKE